jgi:hypothetical protein
MEKEFDFDSSNLLIFILKWKKPLMIIGVTAAVLSAIVSLIIEPKFRSTVIMFPATTSSISKAVISENNTRLDILEFGEEEEAEKLLQILNSDEIRERIKNKFNLMQHYEIEDNEKYKNTKFIKKWESNVNFKRTEFQSVRVDVLDKDPVMAANIANTIADLVDSVKNRMQKERAIEVFKIVEEEFDYLKLYVKSLEDSLTKLRELGVHEYEVQVEMYTKQYSEALAKGNMKAAAILQEKLDKLAKYGSAYVSLREKLIYETERLTLLRQKYEEAKIDATKNIPHKFIVNRAYPAEKKAYPIRWLIVVVSTISALILGIIGIIVLENYQKYAVKSRV